LFEPFLLKERNFLILKESKTEALWKENPTGQRFHLNLRGKSESWTENGSELGSWQS